MTGPSVLQCAAVGPQTTAEGTPSSAYAAAIWALYDGALKEPFRRLESPSDSVYIQGGQLSLYVLSPRLESGVCLCV